MMIRMSCSGVSESNKLTVNNGTETAMAIELKNQKWENDEEKTQKRNPSKHYSTSTSTRTLMLISSSLGPAQASFLRTRF